jgi:hypothetical protein
VRSLKSPRFRPTHCCRCSAASTSGLLNFKAMSCRTQSMHSACGGLRFCDDGFGEFRGLRPSAFARANMNRGARCRTSGCTEGSAT